MEKKILLNKCMRCTTKYVSAYANACPECGYGQTYSVGSIVEKNGWKTITIKTQ